MKLYVKGKKTYLCDLCHQEVYSLTCHWIEGWGYLELCNECHLTKDFASDDAEQLGV